MHAQHDAREADHHYDGDSGTGEQPPLATSAHMQQREDSERTVEQERSQCVTARETRIARE